MKTMALIHDDYMMEIMTITELCVCLSAWLTGRYLERINLRMEVISAQISVPLDIAEQIYGIVYIAPYLDNINEALLVSRAPFCLPFLISDQGSLLSKVWQAHEHRRSREQMH